MDGSISQSPPVFHPLGPIFDHIAAGGRCTFGHWGVSFVVAQDDLCCTLEARSANQNLSLHASFATRSRLGVG